MKAKSRIGWFSFRAARRAPFCWRRILRPENVRLAGRATLNFRAGIPANHLFPASFPAVRTIHLTDSFSIIHVSDLHFHRLPKKPAQWFSKRGLGALNLLLRRARLHPADRFEKLVRKLDAMAWDHLVITGDLTQLGLEEEFHLAREMLRPLLDRGGGRVTIIPGNHDRYVREAEGRDPFGAYFGEFFGDGEIATRPLAGPWRLAGWDSTHPTPPLMAHGTVPRETLAATERWLRECPAETRLIVANHFPLYFMPPHSFRRYHELRNIGVARRWVAAHGVALYLHGHIHNNWVLEISEDGRVCHHVNSASSTRVPRPGESSAFHRILLSGAEYEIQPMTLD